MKRTKPESSDARTGRKCAWRKFRTRFTRWLSEIDPDETWLADDLEDMAHELAEALQRLK